MGYKVVVFDLDGTLLDTLEDIAHCCNKVLVTFGFRDHPVAAYSHFVGEGARRLIEKTTGLKSTELLIDTMCSAFEELYAKEGAVCTALYEGIESMLNVLKSKGIYLAVLSNKPHVLVELCIEHYFPEDTFVKVLGECKGTPRKPAPDALLKIIDSLHVNKEDVLFVGDTKTDMQTGSNARVDRCGVLWGFRERKELEEYGATFVVETPEALAERILQ